MCSFQLSQGITLTLLTGSGATKENRGWYGTTDATWVTKVAAIHPMDMSALYKLMLPDLLETASSIHSVWYATVCMTTVNVNHLALMFAVSSAESVKILFHLVLKLTRKVQSDGCGPPIRSKTQCCHIYFQKQRHEECLKLIDLLVFMMVFV